MPEGSDGSLQVRGVSNIEDKTCRRISIDMVLEMSGTAATFCDEVALFENELIAYPLLSTGHRRRQPLRGPSQIEDSRTIL